MALSMEEKALLQESLNVYLQIMARQTTQQQLDQVAQMADGIMKKLDSLGGARQGKGNKPPGISDEWYGKVCKTCDKLGPDGCTDKVTQKFPGKCDPILHYENNKRRR